MIKDDQGRVPAGQDRHRRRQVLRGADGLKAGDEVITGPFNSVRDLKDGDLVKPEEPKDRT